MKSNKKRSGLSAGIAAGLARVAAGTSWAGVLTVGAGAALLQRLAKDRTGPRWLRVLQALWSAFVLGQVLRWTGGSWQETGREMWIALILLLLAWWLAGKGREAVQSACGVLGMAQAVLLAGVLLGSVRQIQPEHLRPIPELPDGWLVAVLLLPGEGALDGWLWAPAFSLVAAGVGWRGDNAFLEMSRSVSAAGPVRRLESLAAVGLTLGFLLIMAELLSREDPQDRMWSAALAAGLFLGGFYVNGWLAALCAAVAWLILPALCRQKNEINGQSEKI